MSRDSVKGEKPDREHIIKGELKLMNVIITGLNHGNTKILLWNSWQFFSLQKKNKNKKTKNKKTIPKTLPNFVQI